MTKTTWIVVVLVVAAGITAATAVGVSVLGDSGKIPGVAVAPDPVARETIHRTVNLPDGQWRMRSYKSVSGKTCLAQDVPQEAVSTTCASRSSLIGDRDVYAISGGRQLDSRLRWDNLFVYGYVSSRVGSLHLVNLDCSRIDVPFDEDRAFMHVAGTADIARGAAPYKLVARAADGSVLEEVGVKTGLPRLARDAGLREPTPLATCS